MADLIAIEKAYKAAVQTEGRWEPSNVAIGKMHGVTEAYVRKMAKKLNWKRGQDALPPPLPPPPRDLLRRPAADTSGMTNMELTQDLTRRMLDELDTITAHIGELEDLIEAETANDRDDRRRAAMMKAVSLPVRSNTLKLLLAAQAEAEGEGKKGKKEQKAEKAKAVGAGRFAPATAPGLHVVGGGS